MHPEPMGQWAIDQIDEALRTLEIGEAAAPAMIRAWADGLQSFGVSWPDWAKDASYAAAYSYVMGELGTMRFLLVTTRHNIARLGLPTVLRTEATALESGIAAIRTRIAEECSSERLVALTNTAWSSTASPHYLSAYEGQEDQLDSLRVTVATMIRVLRDAADQQDAWYEENLMNVIGTALGVLGVVTAIVGGGVSPLAWVGYISTVIGMLMSGIAYLMQYNGSVEAANALREELAADPLPAWPRPAFAQ